MSQSGNHLPNSDDPPAGFSALGLLVNVGIRRPILLGRKPFEFGRGKADEDGRYDTPLGDLEGQRRRRWLRGGSGRADK